MVRKQIIFLSYFSPRCVRQLDLMFDKYWPLVLYIRFSQRKSYTTTVGITELRAILGYHVLYRYLPVLMEQIPIPVIKKYKDIHNIGLEEQYCLTKFGAWYADYLWKIADIILKADKAKTLTQILEERKKTLMLTIKEINKISSGEKDTDATSETEMNPKLPASVSPTN